MKLYHRKKKYFLKEPRNSYIDFLLKISTSSLLPDKIHQIITNFITNNCSYFTQPDSHKYIKKYIETYKINIKEIEKPPDQYSSLNDFFMRKLKKNARKISSLNNPSVVISPVDCRMMVFPHEILAKSIRIKGKTFNIENLLKSKTKANYFKGCSVVICRLAPQDYHRIHFPVNCQYTGSKKISGHYYSVDPLLVQSNLDVFSDNTKVITYLKTSKFGEVGMISVGATCVGSVIVTAKKGKKYKKGDEYGTFSFGGSTVILLIKKGLVTFSSDLIKKSINNIETYVHLGEQIGKA